jgi:inner membrane protein
MDNITHALAGALFAAATVQSVERRQGMSAPAFRNVAVMLGLVTAELPDADLFYSGEWLGMGQLGYLLHHRGHTHTVLFAIVSALVVWALVLAVRRDLRAPPFARPLLWLSLVGSISHVALDYTNSYGVHPWWPVSNRWVYGDAVFIIEPWIWIAALAPLLFIARGIPVRAVIGLLLLVILVAAWRVSMVSNEVAAALTTGAALWLAVMRAVPAQRRVALGLAAFGALEVMYFAGSGAGRRAVMQQVGPSLRDVVLSPYPGNPFCLTALVVTEETGMYRATSATVAPVPAIRDAASCVPWYRGLREGEPGERRDTPAIRWGVTWSAPVAELRNLARSHCEVAAALRFIRVPAWRTQEEGSIAFFDLRYGEGSFASLVAQPGASCAGPIPPWEWPRQDIIGPAP